ncbi:AAA family ATPase, partial [Actinophytocola sp.]|uniref:AAA family ATPase n=1 Tax=Actinophytocola sp. TaxID=1872138 RepID=UPI003899C637
MRVEMSRKPGISTLSDVLTAKITTAPDWGLVAEFVTACSNLARAASRTLPPMATDLAVWQRRHAELEGQLDAIGRHVRRTAPAAVAAARTLPHDIATFTGRERELKHLTHAITSAKSAGTVGIIAIDGMAGVGKTALAVRAAHRLVGSFPDGQLFLDLHAHTAGQSPVSPTDALQALLSAVGVEPGAVPRNLDQRAALWRDRLASRRILVVLDNAVGHEQVRLLLPGASGACVLITARRRLTALDGAVMMPLEILSPTEAGELFVRAAGTGDPRSAAVGELTRQVGYL